MWSQASRRRQLDFNSDPAKMKKAPTASPRAGPVPEPGHAALAAALLAAVQAQDFGTTPDLQREGAPPAHFPSLDLAVVDFGAGPPRWADVLFSREHPEGIVAEIGDDAGAVRQLRYDADLTDTAGNSIAWQAEADWATLPWRRLAGGSGGSGGRPRRVVAPYPASLLKLMVAVGVGMALDAGLVAGWPAALEAMIVVSDNDATTEMVALLHRCGQVDALNARFAALGLATLRLEGTRPDGGWRNADGSGVGHIHMTAWDTARLLWLLDAQAPLPPWLPPGTALLTPATRDHLHGVLRRQQLDQVLSSGALRGLPGWLPGLPDAPAFAHKTGNTVNYASDAGIVRSGDSHYIVAVLSSLGSRFAPHAGCATTWRLPALGAAVHALLAPRGV